MRDIGVDEALTGEWDGDENCPFMGPCASGQVLEGTVANVGMQGTIVVERDNVRYTQKYERYEKRISALSAHLPNCIGGVEVGDRVKIMECRPLSKTVSFCVIENNGGELMRGIAGKQTRVCQQWQDFRLLTTLVQRLLN